jgi:hypothetical protein
LDKAELDSFFRIVPKEDQPKSDKLHRVLRERLSGVPVYKLGEDAEKLFLVEMHHDGPFVPLSCGRGGAAFRRAVSV